MNFIEKAKGLTSKRLREIHDDTPTPTAFQAVGGWGSAADTAFDDPIDSVRDARREGARALAALVAERLEERRAENEARFAGVQRGYDYSRPGGPR